MAATLLAALLTGSRAAVRVLVVAVSARMLAELAVADGYEVTALDRFGDVDLRAVAPGSDRAEQRRSGCARRGGRGGRGRVRRAGSRTAPIWWRGWRDGRELLGTPPELLAAVRDPWAVGGGGAGGRGARTRDASRGRRAPCAAPASGCASRCRGGGGRGVRRWARRPAARPRRSSSAGSTGCRCSAVAIGDGRRAAVLGLTEQLHRPRGFGWMGNVTPPRLPDAELAELDGQLRAVCDEVAARFGVRGAFGVDAIWDGRHAWVLEVNPRPPASLELFGPGSFEAHVRGARGVGLPAAGTPPATPCAKVKLVLFADRDLRAPDPGWWPAGPRARHPARRRDDQARRAGVHADLGRRGRARARRARSAAAVRTPRGGARPWLSSARSRAPGVACCATT